MLTWLMNPAKQAKDVSLQEKLGNLHWKGYRSSFEQNPFIILEMNKLDLKSQMTWWEKKDPKCPVNKDGGWKGSSMTLLYIECLDQLLLLLLRKMKSIHTHGSKLPKICWMLLFESCLCHANHILYVCIQGRYKKYHQWAFGFELFTEKCSGTTDLKFSLHGIK